MEISFIGLGVCVGVWLLGALLGSPLIVGLIVSVAFGSTSAVTLSALGGSSPLLYLVFEIVLVGCVLFDKRQLAGIVEILGRDSVSWAVGALIVYSTAGAFIMPRLFAGATNAFVAGRATGVVEVALAPNSGNITQTGYFILGALTFLILSSRLARGEPLALLRDGFFALATINALTGVLDLGAKMAGAGDVFMPIRTATFAYLTEVEQAGFWRINGLYSEASAYGGATLASLAFTFTYWAHGGSRRALLLSAILFILLVLSTSSTAYGGLAILIVPVAASLIASVMRGQLESSGMVVLACIIVAATTIIFVSLYDPKILDPLQHLFQTTVLDKSDSESGRERAYWNERSLLSFYETFGLGIGFGSSRASNWLIAMISQLGAVGALLQFSLLIPFLRRPRRPQRSSPAHDSFVLHRSLCACVFGTLVTAIVGGGAADPGLLFFVALAGVLACQASLSRSPWLGSDVALPASHVRAPASSSVGQRARIAPASALAIAGIFRPHGHSGEPQAPAS